MKKLGYLLGVLFLSSTVLIGCATSQSTADVPIFYVANAGDGTISKIDINNSDPSTVIDLDYEQLSHGIAISPDETVIYTGSGFSAKSVLAIDSQSHEVLQEVKFEEGVHGIDIHPTGKYLYISLMAGLGEEGGTLAVVDTETFETMAFIKTDDGPAHVDVSIDGSQVWVANVNANTISVVDAYTFQNLANIEVGEVPNEVALSPTLDYAYSANVRSNNLSIIDMTTFEVVDEISVGEGVHGVTVSHDGKQVWTANNHSNDVSVIDTETFTIIDTIDTGSYPNHISFSPDGMWAFVTHRESNDLAVIETQTRKVEKTVPLGSEPHEMTLKGLVKNDSNVERNTERFANHFTDYIDGVELEVALLSPYIEENVTKIKEVADKDLFNYYVIEMNLTTHSGDLTSLPWTDMITITNRKEQKLPVVEWIVLNNDSHHPVFLAIFDKTINQKPLLKSIDDVLFLEISPFINTDKVEISLLD